MIIVISPAKTLDFEEKDNNLPMSEPRFLEKSQEIMNELTKYDSYSLEKLMKISTKLATLNRDRIEKWTTRLDTSKQALLAFRGDAYRGMDVGSLSHSELFYANDHLRILSGLYGVLRPESRYLILLLLGIPFGLSCYFLFRWWIVKFDVKTPGRGGEYDQSMEMMDEEGEVGKNTDPSVLKAKVIISGLGGAENIDVVDCCITRLRVIVKDMSLVSEEKIKTTGCMGIVKVDENNIQIIYGPSVNVVKNSVNKQLALA